MLQFNTYPLLFQIDFDKWKTEEEEEEEERARNPENALDALNPLTEQPSFNLENLKKIYLVIYNMWQFLGFLYIFMVLLINYLKDGNGNYVQWNDKHLIVKMHYRKPLTKVFIFILESIATAYKSVHHALKFCQLMQLLEIFHPLFGYTKGGLLEPILQVGGRGVIL